MCATGTGPSEFSQLGAELAGIASSHRAFEGESTCWDAYPTANLCAQLALGLASSHRAIKCRTSWENLLAGVPAPHPIYVASSNRSS